MHVFSCQLFVRVRELMYEEVKVAQIFWLCLCKTIWIFVEVTPCISDSFKFALALWKKEDIDKQYWLLYL